ncbi:hypothetical protein EDC18_105116 [Natranaerovirga pectinivora]|uniref:Copper amine oxidase-like N-terminal domain-containing protein n=1 Tax=Natranaerovirga pectinivora TaxID=682400 RepID=A0A4R3MK28_9FIRM|nr:TraB/GumN family protein [Natranaerovirga pectinivora]TCT14635.1 hypothetical protein EDC18_105116 [Natranaerovirga pectinivora]
MKKSSKFILALVLCTTLLFTPIISGNEVQEVNLLVNHIEVEFDQSALWVEDTLYVPFRPLFDTLGGEVIWDEASRTATGIFEEYTVSIQIDTQMISTNDETFINEDILILNGRLLIPAKMATELLPVYAYWFEEYNAVLLAIPSQGFLWEVNHNDVKVYMLGSIHFGRENMYPLRNEITNAFLTSDYLALEADGMNISNETVEYITSKMMYTDGTTIKDHISEETYDELVSYLTNLGVDIELVITHKPWQLAMELSGLFYNFAEAYAELGIETYFLNMKPEEMPIIELEGLISQIDMLDGFSKDLQEINLLSSLVDLEETVMGIDSLYETWMKGDLATLESLVFPELDEEMTEKELELFNEYNNAMHTVRNHGMADSIEEFLLSDEAATYFVIIGAAHFVGEDSIINILIDKGFEVISYN